MDADKAKLREGESARARFFRRKDEILGGGEDGGMKALSARVYQDGDPSKGMTDEGSKAMDALMPLFKDVRSVIDELHQKPDDEDLLQKGTEALQRLKAKQDELLPPK